MAPGVACRSYAASVHNLLQSLGWAGPSRAGLGSWCSSLRILSARVHIQRNDGRMKSFAFFSSVAAPFTIRARFLGQAGWASSAPSRTSVVKDAAREAVGIQSQSITLAFP